MKELFEWGTGTKYYTRMTYDLENAAFELYSDADRTNLLASTSVVEPSEMGQFTWDDIQVADFSSPCNQAFIDTDIDNVEITEL